MGFFRRLFGKSSTTSIPAFDIAQNMLYQPDPELKERVPDIGAFADFLKWIESEGAKYWSEVPLGTGQALTIFVALKPGRQARFWLESSPGGLGTSALAPFADRLGRLPVPAVRVGPVAFAMHATLWGGLPGGGGWAFIPTEWQTQCAGQELVVPDGVLGIVWPDKEAELFPDGLEPLYKYFQRIAAQEPAEEHWRNGVAMCECVVVVRSHRSFRH